LEIRKIIFRWIGHTLRKVDVEIPKAAILWNPQGSRKRGRPKNSQRRSVIKEASRSWNELRFLALLYTLDKPDDPSKPGSKNTQEITKPMLKNPFMQNT
jgi:hypothetical protein